MISRGQQKLMAPRQAVQWKGYITGSICFPGAAAFLPAPPASAALPAHRVLPPLQVDRENDFASSDSLSSYPAAFNARS